MGVIGLLKYVLVGLAVWMLYRGVKSVMGGDRRQARFRDADGEVLDVMVQDPQ